MKFIVHPDGLVTVESFDIFYQDTVENFNLDASATLDPLPDGYASMIYRDGILTFYDIAGNAYPKEGIASPGQLDIFLSNITQIQSSKNTRVAAAEPILTSGEMQERVKQEVREQRDRIFSRLDGLQISAVVVADSATANTIETIKGQLRTLTSDVDLSALPDIAAMRSAFINRWRQIAFAAPANLQSAFLSLDQ